LERRIDKYLFTWVGTFLLGGLGVDRFMRGQIGFGLLKLITAGSFGLWMLIDWIIALSKLGQYDRDFVFIDGYWKY
jgi:TM2 domain-containing membrane protein YozV